MCCNAHEQRCVVCTSISSLTYASVVSKIHWIFSCTTDTRHAALIAYLRHTQQYLQTYTTPYLHGLLVNTALGTTLNTSSVKKAGSGGCGSTSLGLGSPGPGTNTNLLISCTYTHAQEVTTAVWKDTTCSYQVPTFTCPVESNASRMGHGCPHNDVRMHT